MTPFMLCAFVLSFAALAHSRLLPQGVGAPGVRLWNGSHVNVLDTRACTGRQALQSLAQSIGKIDDPKARLSAEGNNTYWSRYRANKIDGWMSELFCSPRTTGVSDSSRVKAAPSPSAPHPEVHSMPAFIIALILPHRRSRRLRAAEAGAEHHHQAVVDAGVWSRG
jgi:hypothetical protein